ncbi:MAG: serine/threonine protein kinase [Crenarchaeota archaeon]|nr:serine/threonine protein kinase [Thermoproteota archaeon]
MKIGEVFRRLVNEDFAILGFFVRNLRRFEYIPVEYIAQKLRRFPPKELDARLRKLHKLKLIERHPTMDAYRLKMLGLDCYALKILADRDVLRAIGDMVGVGKESDIYRAMGPKDELVVVKFFRIGRTSFRNVTRVRDYGVAFERGTWLVRSIVAGRREREALRILNEAQVPNVPRLRGGCLHAVVMDYFEGVELFEVKELSDPDSVLTDILDTVRIAYWRAKLVHGDLSEYNIIVTEGEKPIVIDWPQYLTTVDPNARRVLERDVLYITRFFRKRFRVPIEFEEALQYVLSPLDEGDSGKGS